MRNPLPKVSVLIVAIDRTEFLEAALESVLSQTEPSDSFEIVLVTNRKECADTLELLRNSTNVDASVVMTTDRRQGLVFSAGIDACSGDVISFLNDDDLWGKDKVARVRSIFGSYPSLGYYRHSFVPVNKFGETVRLKLGRSPSEDFRTRQRFEYVRAADLTKRWNRLGSLGVDVNDSTISIRTSVIRPRNGYLRLLGGSEDTFFFYVAASSGCDILVDNLPLSKWRVHSTSMSSLSGLLPQGGSEKMLRATRRFQDATAVIRTMLSECGQDELVGKLDRESSFLALLYNIQAATNARTDTAATLAQFFPHLLQFKPRQNLELGVLGLVAVFLPTLARRIYYSGS
jgi:hypothetical protein